MRKPDFFIVGAPRSGTTSMKTYLDKHPEIFVAPGREPHFFGTDFYLPSDIRDERTYLSLFATANNEKRVGEKSVRYLSSKRAAAEIKEFQPSASIIIMLRNPVEMIYSLHNHIFNLGFEDLDDFKAALEAEEDRKRGLRLPMGLDSRENWRVFYRETARYAQQVNRFLNTFGREKVHIIIFDDFVSQTAEVYRETLRFLMVNPDFQIHFQKTNSGGRILSRKLYSLMIDPHQPVRSFVQAAMPYSLIQRAIWGLINLYSRYFARPPINPEFKRQLQKEFLPEVERLSELLGRDLTHWCQSD
jgi:hypothetical protein